MVLLSPCQQLIKQPSRQSAKTQKNQILTNRITLGIYRTLPTAAAHKFFSSNPGTLTWLNHTLGRKTNVNTFKMTEIIHSISNRKTAGKSLNSQKLTPTGMMPRYVNTETVQNACMHAWILRYICVYVCLCVCVLCPVIRNSSFSTKETDFTN